MTTVLGELKGLHVTLRAEQLLPQRSFWADRPPRPLPPPAFLLPHPAELVSSVSTWAGRRQHGQGLLGAGLFSESLHKLSLALQETEVPREGGVKHVVCPCKVSTHGPHEGWRRVRCC